MVRTGGSEIELAPASRARSSELGLAELRGWSGAEWWALLGRLVMLVFGLFLFALAMVLSLQSNLGANSWMVLHDGMARNLPLTIGQTSQLVGVLMIVVSWTIGIRPGIGTITNMILVGLFIDLILWTGIVDRPEDYLWRAALLAGAIGLIGIASGIYIGAGLGAGPRDSFNLALTEMTGLSVGLTRWMVESLAVVIGILLGGDFGIGTIVFALLVGPSVGFGFRLFGLPTRSAPPGTGRRRGPRRTSDPDVASLGKTG